MNKRIQELMEQAGAWNIPDEFCEKFAELIIRECANIAYEFDIPNRYGPGEFIANRIQRRLGVLYED
jgi:hypothetical protein